MKARAERRAHRPRQGFSSRNGSAVKFSMVNSSLLKGIKAISDSLVYRSDTPIASDLVSLVASENWQAIANLSIDPNCYSSAEQFALDYQAVSLIRKCEHLPIEIDRVGAAMTSWSLAEESCRWINHNNGIDPFEPNMYPGSNLRTSLEATIWLARDKIRNCLGKFDWNEAHASFGFSGGASTRLKRRNGHPFYKFSGKPEVTRSAALLSVCAIWSIPLWREQMQAEYGNDPCNWVTVVEGSKVTTVRKTALTDRVIAIEPDMNMYIQKGIGAVIRRRLKRVRVDLNDQSRNQYLSLLGSRTGSLSTIDLQSASDSIAMSLVRQLLPHDWLDAIEQTRCEDCTLPDGTKHRLEKVSSMGNGFTFELESLIFWALSSATLDVLGVPDKRLGIYGDDIVIHNSAADHLIRVLKRCGFVTNMSKTHVSGPFRESCGTHYFYGVDVTPFYVKSQTDCISSHYWLANSYRSWVDRAPVRPNQGVYKSLVNLCVRRAKGLVCYVPEALGMTAGIICNFDEACPSWSLEDQCFLFHRLVPVRKRHDPSGVPALLAWLSNSSDTVSKSQLVIEHGDVRYVRRKARISWWCTTSNAVVLGTA